MASLSLSESPCYCGTILDDGRRDPSDNRAGVVMSTDVWLSFRSPNARLTICGYSSPCMSSLCAHGKFRLLGMQIVAGLTYLLIPRWFVLVRSAIRYTDDAVSRLVYPMSCVETVSLYSVTILFALASFQSIAIGIYAGYISMAQACAVSTAYVAQNGSQRYVLFTSNNRQMLRGVTFSKNIR